MPDRDVVIGIDLGTTNSVVATVQGDQPMVIRNRTGQNLTPSVVAISKNGKQLVGQLAKRQAITNPEGTVYATKRLIGRKYSSEQVAEALKVLSYPVVCGEHDDIRVRLGGRDISLPEISAKVLGELKLDAEEFFGHSVTKAVITVPAYFNDGQRQATKDAGKIAGLDVLRILNEPTAAALAYGFGKNVNGRIAIFDLGGGTFDISVLEVSKGVFEVIATGGDSYLGGEDFDHRILEWLVFGFAKEHGVDLRKDRMALQRLKDAAEKAKIELSETKSASINLPFICTPSGGGAALHLQRALTREKLEELTADLCERTLSITAQVLEEAKVKPSDLKEVILVGGMTRMPRIAGEVKKFFRREPCKGVHPEEVVGLGAAVQAHALTSDQAPVLLLDVTPHSLGVAIAGGYARRLISKNTTVPTSCTEVFTTSKDQQTTVKIMVLQGESEVAHENELLGEFSLTNLRAALRGQVQVEVAFDINSEGIVSVSAKDKETGQEASIIITPSGGLTEDEMQTIMSEQDDLIAETGESEDTDAKKSELSELVDQVKDLFPRVKQVLTDSEFGMDAVNRVEKTLTTARKALGAKRLATVNHSIEQLSRTLQLFKSLQQRAGIEVE
jgi:molecular chaperone DnaK